jgi:hypothetical protein
VKQFELFDNSKKAELDWDFMKPYKIPLTRLFYRILYYKEWKIGWGFGNFGVFDPLLGGEHLKAFMNRVMDNQLSYIFKRPILDVFVFDDWLHEEFGNYEDEGLSMKDLIELKFDKETLSCLQAISGAKR